MNGILTNIILNGPDKWTIEQAIGEKTGCCSLHIMQMRKHTNYTELKWKFMEIMNKIEQIRAHTNFSWNFTKNGILM